MKATSMFAFLLLICGAVCSQTVTDKASSSAQKRKTNKVRGRDTRSREQKTALSLEKRSALERLEVAGDRARSLDASITKTKTLVMIADALWEHNEARARQLFVAAFQSIDAIKLDAGVDQRAAIAERRGGRFGPLFQLRSSVLERVARRDFNLAETLRQTFEKEAEDDGDLKKARLDRKAEESQLSLNLAVALAKSQPERAAQLIRGLFSNEVDVPLIFALLRVRIENPPLADQLFREVLTSRRTNPMLSDELGSFAIYVLPGEADLFFGNDPANDVTRIPAVRMFLDYVYSGLVQWSLGNAASPNAANGLDAERADSDYQTLKNILPLFERLQPERVAFVNERMGTLLSFMTTRDANAAQPAHRESIDDLIRQAESTVGDERRTMRFMRASNAAMEQGDVEKALAIAERIDDLYERKIQTSVVLYQATMRELGEDKLERAYQFAQRIEFLPQRVAVFHRIAQKLWRDRELDDAETKMVEIWDWLGKTGNSPQKVDAMLKLTATMAQHDTVRGFEWLQSTTRALNATDFSLKPLELHRLSAELQIPIDMLDLESSFGPLAKQDFERAFLIAHSLTKVEAALLAEAIVCKQVLQLQ